MEKYFTYILDLMNYVSTKEREVLDLKTELSQIINKKNRYLNDINRNSKQISEISFHKEEKEERFKYKFFPIILFLILLFAIVISVYYETFTYKFLFFNIPVILTFPICKVLSKKSQIKYHKLREERELTIKDMQQSRDLLLKEYKDLTIKENTLLAKIQEMEADIKNKRIKIDALETNMITSLAPILDELINDEITKNNNNELQEELLRIREIYF